MSASPRPHSPSKKRNPAGILASCPRDAPVSGTSMLELDRPTDKISLSQYAALTLTGAIFSRYGLVVTPINYPPTSVNVLLFLSSAWHLGRKIKADYL